MPACFVRLGSLAIAAAICAVIAPPAQAQVRPAVTKNVDEPGRIPYQVIFQAAKGDPNCGTNFCVFFTPNVPANKRLVITNVAITINLDSTATAQAVYLSVEDATTVYGQLYLPYNPNAYPVDPISAYSPRRYVVNESVRLYADAGQHLRLAFHTTGGNLADGWPQLVLITGYLVDLTL